MTPETQPSRARKTPADIYDDNPAFAVGLDAVRAGLAAGIFAGDAHSIATVLWTNAHGAIASILTFPAFPLGDPDAYVARVVDLTIAGLQVRPLAPL